MLPAFLKALESGWGLDVILWFQSWRTPFIYTTARVISESAIFTGLTLIVLAVYWCLDPALGRRLGLLYVLAGWLNQWLKEWWMRPRPYQVSPEVDIPAGDTTFGLPSGHSQVTATVWGAIAWHVRRWWATLLIAVYVLLVMTSRLVLGIHFPQDVIAGAALGLLSVALYTWLEPRLSAWLSRQSTWTLFVLVFAAAIVLFVVQPTLFPGVAEHRPMGVVMVGAFLGLAVGFVLEVRTLGFSAEGVWWKRVLRFLLGLIVAGAIGLPTRSAMLVGADIPILLGGALAGWWIGYGAPWVFVRIGLADRR
jgi:membrane-associated phospholipid phosphatase